MRLIALIHRRTVSVLAALVISGLVGCAQLPTQVNRPPSTALSVPTGTSLATLVQQRHDTDKARFNSGFVLLEGPKAAYGSRLALVQAAQKTLDLQYYAIHADESTRRLMLGVREAAARGVRVRILIDDFHSTGQDALVLQLAFVDNIEVRLFNPLAGTRGSTLGRVFNSINDVSRIQQRMHNKLFLADNALGVAGGRNLGDAYFGNDQNGNFVDLDVLAAGPIVQDLSRSFDAYWNNERSYPVPSLVKREDLDAIRDEVRAKHDEASISSAAAATATTVAVDEQPYDLRAAAFIWAPAVMLVDRPGKIAANSDEAASASGVAANPGANAPGLVVSEPADARPSSKVAKPASNEPAGNRLVSLETAADTVAGSDTVVEGLLQLIGQAQRDLLIISPYFVPGPDITQALALVRERGVRIRVLTNSLASNDAPIAHVGYARHREELLKLGIELYEMRSEQPGVRGAFGSSGKSLMGDSRAMLHSKALVMDGRLLVIGSMNLDLRSQLQNTEVALLIGSIPLSRIATDAVEKTLRQNAWHVELSEGSLIWRAPEIDGLQDTRSEPDASFGLKLLVKVLGPLAPDSML
jgi:putative cardiolipin synthase